MLNSDYNTILEVADNYEHVKARKRSAELAEDDSPAIKYVLHTISCISDDFDLTVIYNPAHLLLCQKILTGRFSC